MRMRYQVCDTEQAIRLLNLGCVLDTQWYWDYKNDYLEPKMVVTGWFIANRDNPKRILLNKQFSAPTVAEVGVLLRNFLSQLSYYKGKWECQLMVIDGKSYFYKTFFGETEAKSKTEALIWLIESKYLKIEDLKL